MNNHLLNEHIIHLCVTYIHLQKKFACSNNIVVSTTNNSNYCTFLQHLEHCVKQQKGNFPIFGSEFDAFFSFHRELQIHNRVGAKYQAVRYSFNAVIY